MAYRVMARDIDGTIWLERHNADYTMWSTDKADAFPFEHVEYARGAVEEIRKTQKLRNPDNMAGQFRIVRAD